MRRLNTQVVEDLCVSLSDTDDRGWAGARLVHVGSALEYGRIGGPIHEHCEPAPTTEYGRTKLAATRQVQSHAVAARLPAVVARLFTVYGPGEHSDRLLPSLLRAARVGGRVALSQGRQRRDFTYVEDAVEGLLRLAMCHRPAGEIVNVATGVLVPVREFAVAAAAVLGIPEDRLDFGALPDLPEEMWQGSVDVTRLRTLTGWVPATMVADGVRRSWEFEHA
jgi:nucleoside-diphosphate-sugar epimerase